MQELEAKVTETFRGLVESGRVDEIIRTKLEGLAFEDEPAIVGMIRLRLATAVRPC